MDSLETGKDKIKKICEILKNESLEPAKQEAQRIIEVAETQAEQIIQNATKKSLGIETATKAKLEKEKEIFHSSLVQAGRQALETLRQEIEKALFNEEFIPWVEKSTQDPNLIAELIKGLVAAIEKEGTSADFSAEIPKKLSAEKVNALLSANILNKLREKNVVLGDFSGGVQIRLHDKNVTLDISDTALKELLGSYLRKDFRKILFST